MNQTFGQVFQCPLVNTTVSVYNIPDVQAQMKILLISDTHIGATMDVEKATTLFIDCLREVISQEGITHICHLGDLVDGTLMDGKYVLPRVLKRLSEFELPVYAIGGNHDREFFAGMSWEGDAFVVPSKQLAMLVEYNGTKVYLAHDLANNYRVRDAFAYSFVSWIKDGCKKTIRPEDWLVTGHTHTGLLSHAARISCVGQFSPEIKSFGYGVLEVGPDGILISNKYMTGRA